MPGENFLSRPPQNNHDVLKETKRCRPRKVSGVCCSFSLGLLKYMANSLFVTPWEKTWDKSWDKKIKNGVDIKYSESVV